MSVWIKLHWHFKIGFGCKGGCKVTYRRRLSVRRDSASDFAPPGRPASRPLAHGRSIHNRSTLQVRPPKRHVSIHRARPHPLGPLYLDLLQLLPVYVRQVLSPAHRLAPILRWVGPACVRACRRFPPATSPLPRPKSAGGMPQIKWSETNAVIFGYAKIFSSCVFFASII